MGIIHIMERGGDDYREYKKAVKMAKEAIDTICDLTEDMEEQFSSRDGWSERGRYRGNYSKRNDEDMEMYERRSRDSRGRYR